MTDYRITKEQLKMISAYVENRPYNGRFVYTDVVIETLDAVSQNQISNTTHGDPRFEMSYPERRGH